MSLSDRIALVTGADRGIGRAVALALASAGAHVAVACLERRDAAELVASQVLAAGRRATVVAGDVSVQADVVRMVAQTAAALGEPDVLVANAGIAPPAVLETLDAATFDRTVAVNLRSAFLLAQAVVPAMRRRHFGRLLFVSSTAAQVGGIIGPHYAASKAGLLGLMHAYAAALAPDGITANVIAPALVATDMIAGNRRARPDAIPVRRFGTPEEVAELAVAVLDNGYVTGQTLQVNGGLYFT